MVSSLLILLHCPPLPSLSLPTNRLAGYPSRSRISGRYGGRQAAPPRPHLPTAISSRQFAASIFAEVMASNEEFSDTTVQRMIRGFIMTRREAMASGGPLATPTANWMITTGYKELFACQPESQILQFELSCD